jgi:hypothetical protein
LLIYGSYTGGFTVTFPYIHVLYPLIILPPTLFPFLRGLQQVSTFHVYTRIESTPTILTLLTSIFYPPSPTIALCWK